MDEVNWNAVGVIVGVTSLVVIYFGWQPTLNWFRGLEMKKQRREEVQTILTGGFVDFIVECIADGDITPEEAREEGYNRLRRLYPTVKEIHPSEDWLKERIERRLRAAEDAKEPAVEPETKRRTMLSKTA